MIIRRRHRRQAAVSHQLRNGVAAARRRGRRSRLGGVVRWCAIAASGPACQRFRTLRTVDLLPAVRGRIDGGLMPPAFRRRASAVYRRCVSAARRNSHRPQPRRTVSVVNAAPIADRRRRSDVVCGRRVCVAAARRTAVQLVPAAGGSADAVVQRRRVDTRGEVVQPGRPVVVAAVRRPVPGRSCRGAADDGRAAVVPGFSDVPLQLVGSADDHRAAEVTNQRRRRVLRLLGNLERSVAVAVVQFRAAAASAAVASGRRIQNTYDSRPSHSANNTQYS